MMVAWDDRGNIGKRYFAQDEAGTPFCITVDFQTLEDETVTVRDRDTAKQDRIAISGFPAYYNDKVKNYKNEFLDTTIISGNHSRSFRNNR